MHKIARIATEWEHFSTQPSGVNCVEQVKVDTHYVRFQGIIIAQKIREVKTLQITETDCGYYVAVPMISYHWTGECEEVASQLASQLSVGW